MVAPPITLAFFFKFRGCYSNIFFASSSTKQYPQTDNEDGQRTVIDQLLWLIMILIVGVNCDIVICWGNHSLSHGMWLRSANHMSCCYRDAFTHMSCCIQYCRVAFTHMFTLWGRHLTIYGYSYKRCGTHTHTPHTYTYHTHTHTHHTHTLHTHTHTHMVAWLASRCHN